MQLLPTSELKVVEKCDNPLWWIGPCNYCKTQTIVENIQRKDYIATATCGMCGAEICLKVNTVRQTVRIIED